MIFRPIRLSPVQPLLLLIVLLAGVWATVVRADVLIEVTGVEGALRDNVINYIGQPPSTDAAVVRRFARQVEERTQNGLQALGHYHATVRVSRDTVNDQPRIRVEVDPGEPTRIARINLRIDGEGGDDSALRDVLARSGIREGDVLHHGRYESLKRNIESVALSRGYFDGRYETTRLVVRRASREAEIILHYDSGRRYRFGDVQFSETPLSDDLLRRLTPFSPGEYYHSDTVARFNRNLLNSDYFRNVRVRTLQAESEDETVPVLADLTPQSRNIVGTGIGYSTDVGPRVRVNWRRPYVNPEGHSLLTETEVSEVRQNISSTYSMPLDPPLEHKLEFLGGYQRERFEDTESETYTLGIQRQRTLTRGWQQTLFTRWQRENFTQAGDRGRSTLTIPGSSISRTRSRGGIDPGWGDRQFAQVEVTNRELGSDIQLARLRLRSSWLRSYGRHRGRVRAEVGWLTTEDFDATPSSLRFFTGGDQSVRGYAYRSLAPRNEDGDLVGGRYLFTASAEYGYQILERWRLAAFYDVGNAFDSWDDDLKEGAGFGVRWISPVGPIRLDFAWGVSEPDTPFRLHFSMGPEI
ncbi:translocation and assembly module TamA [Natronocella acetinitrilica]|uniref:Translocation and assembly module subunit TamA n=1 Tax=Natronocella acetinitrilica TaxID=414046 RepID=A0AAE3G7Y3_9GAMM|nr:autotransporter assembly complex family protein [Natronocella acetinitrilica]MCP1676078.1 translocation and assembly module TamA [Natronocella acetinitrilica]